MIEICHCISPHPLCVCVCVCVCVSRYIFEFFKSANLTRETYGTLLDQLSKVISYLTTAQTSVHRNGNNIQKFVDAVKVTTEAGVLTQHYA